MKFVVGVILKIVEKVKYGVAAIVSKMNEVGRIRNEISRLENEMV